MPTDGEVSRHAYSVSGRGRTDATHRLGQQDRIPPGLPGAEQRNQWGDPPTDCCTRSTKTGAFAVNAQLRQHQRRYRFHVWRAAGPRLTRVFAFSPARQFHAGRCSGRYTYLYNLASPGQVSGDNSNHQLFAGPLIIRWIQTPTKNYDQRTKVASLEGIYRLDDRWEVAGKGGQSLG